MKELSIARLFILQKELRKISLYSYENCRTLFGCSIKLEPLLEVMLKLNEDCFDPIYQLYYQQVQGRCRLCCELTDEYNKQQTFILGLKQINLILDQCITILAKSNLAEITAAGNFVLYRN